MKKVLLLLLVIFINKSYSKEKNIGTFRNATKVPINVKFYDKEGKNIKPFETQKGIAKFSLNDFTNTNKIEVTHGNIKDTISNCTFFESTWKGWQSMSLQNAIAKGTKQIEADKGSKGQIILYCRK